MRFPFSILPREDKFFFLLEQSASNLKKTSVALNELMENYENVPAKVDEIKNLEEIGDNIIHTIMTSLHKTFITPLDREDIAALGERMDDIVDSIEEAARIMVEYKIEEPTEKSKELSRIIVKCANTLEKAVGLLHSRGSKLQDILPLTAEVNTFENQADQVSSAAMAELFNEEVSAIYVLKWKEVYTLIEGATVICEVAVIMLEGIVLKHA